jgi:hypothetical protein
MANATEGTGHISMGRELDHQTEMGLGWMRP